MHGRHILHLSHKDWNQLNESNKRNKKRFHQNTHSGPQVRSKWDHASWNLQREGKEKTISRNRKWQWEILKDTSERRTAYIPIQGYLKWEKENDNNNTPQGLQELNKKERRKDSLKNDKKHSSETYHGNLHVILKK